MRAISTFSREAGTSTFWCRACSALRTLVSISATGSFHLLVCFPPAPRSVPPGRGPCGASFLLCHPERDAFCLAKDLSAPHDHSCVLCENADSCVWRVSSRPSLPGRLRNSRNLPAQCQSTEAQAAQAELAQISPRPSTYFAAVVPPRGKLRCRFFLLARHLKLLFDLCVLHSFRCSHEILREPSLSNLRSQKLEILKL